MLGNCEKTTVIPPTTNEWPQNQIDEKVFMASNVLMEKPGQELLQHQQALKCPRCDSSNTKFCYYNNYSLSQPRHFCKACKRYWTRGGTLRNVPVGGGCRKNKRINRPSSAIDAASASSSPAPAVATTKTAPAQSQIDVSSTANHVNPLFYGLPTNPSDMNLSFPRFNSRVSNFDAVSGYDLQPQLDALGLGFSSAAGDSYNRSGFDSTKQIQDILSNYSIFGSSTSTTSSANPSMASLLASSFHQQKFINGGGVKDARAPNHFQTLSPFEDLQISNNSEAGIAARRVKVEEGQHRLDWNVPNCQSHIEQINLSDPFVYWNATNVGAWNDPANLGSSVTSLI